MLSVLEKTGASALASLAFWGELVRLVFSATHSSLIVRWRSARATLRVVAAQTYFTGWQAMPLVCLLAFVTGCVLVFYTHGQSTPFSGGDMGSTLLYVLVWRELGPLITGLIVIARSGSAIASELGNMRANGETDALQTLAIDPLSFLVFPRLVAGLISVCCLVIYFDAVAALGAYLTTALFTPTSFTGFIAKVIKQVQLEDLVIIAIKTVLTGTVIFSVSALFGLRVGKSSHEVPQVTTKAVVTNIVIVTLLNFLLTGVLLWRHFQGAEL